jgi:hypothetical protein
MQRIAHFGAHGLGIAEAGIRYVSR